MKNKKVTFFSRRRFRRTGSFVLAAAMLAGSLYIAPSALAEAAETEYEIYPTPHVTTYGDGDYIIRNDVNVVYESGIDDATKDRLSETLALKSDISVSESGEIVDGKTNILVGIDGSGEYVDKYVDDNITVSTEGLFDELDSYVLDSDDGVITVLGADTDASFYGLTSLYHVIKQMDSYTIRNFHIEDWADVASRGFIEGYYGNPWSTEDRANLMTWGGYYKLNSYFYAPKNDPKHNASWRELYTDAEIETLIKPLAEAGNASKCRYVYALHPFMTNAIRFNTEENYQADLAIVQKKFEQVIEAGVRQVAILADDAAHVGNDNYVKFLKDMTDWLAKMKEKYPDLKQTLPFVTQEYMYYGETYYQNFPENVQIVMTGGRVWGEVTDSFTSTFTNNAGRGPYMWINWPCTDNSKKHLIMGGYTTFLHPGVDPDKLQGIVLNPMQQSEPSKVAIFGNACYSWNIWESNEEADQAWNDSFKYVDHNSAIETEASNALRELSKHMINQAMDNRVTALQESVELKELLTPFKEKLTADTYTVEEIEAIEKEFEILQDAADTYEAQAGDQNVKNQIIYWLNCWDDTTDAALAYLAALKDYKSGDNSSLVSDYTKGQQAFNQSKTYGFLYVDHDEYAEVGVQHIVPFISAMGSYLSQKVQEVADPTVVTKTFISDVFKTPYSGSVDNLFDSNDSTTLVFHEPNFIYKDNYIGVRFNKGITLNDVRISSGGGKNHFFYSKLQYLEEGADETDGWKDVTDEVYERPNGSTDPIVAEGLNIPNVVAVRLIATQDNGVDSWLTINSFDINTSVAEGAEQYDVTEVTLSDNLMESNGSAGKNAAVDGNLSTELWVQNSDGKDNTPENAAVILNLGEVKAIGSVYVAQGYSKNTDILDSGVIEYSVDGNEWENFGKLESKTEQTVTGYAQAQYIRIRNTAQKGIWWRVSDIQVFASEEVGPFTMTASALGTQIGNNPAINDGAKNNKFEYIVDGNDSTLAWLANDKNGNIDSGIGIVISFSRAVDMKEISLLQGEGDKVSTLKVEYQNGDDNWHELTTVQDAGAEVTVQADGTQATAIRLTNGAAASTGKWWQVYEVSVTENAEMSGENVYTNVKGANFTALVDDDSAQLSAGKITLGENDYLGIDMKEIKKLASADIDFGDVEGIKLQYSKNGKVWEEADGSVANETARYIRLINTSSEEKEITIAEFTATLYNIGKFGELVSSDIPINASWGDTRTNGQAFDGNMTTQTKFGGSAKAGNTAVFSLGQEIAIKSLRIYTADNTQDYVRDVMVQVSTDGEEWKDAFEIGDGVADTAEEANQTMMDAGAGEVDTNYPNVRYYGSDELDLKARYIRLYVTADFPSRSLIINEVVINNGAYVSSEGNMAFEGTLEEEGYQPSNMLDKDFTTAYKPSEENGSITYNISDGEGVKSFRIIQSGEASNAVVKAEVYDEESGEAETVEAGTLSQAINEFKVPEGKTLLAITVEWKDKLPEISEMFVLTDELADADTSDLEALLKADPEGYDSWTKASKDAYDAMKAVAQSVLDSKYASQTMVDTAVAGLLKAADDAELRADEETLGKLQALISEKAENNNTYTVVSYMNYESAVTKAEAAFADKENLSQTDAEALITSIETAKAGLTYSVRNRELAELAVEAYAAFNADNYTTSSYQALTDAKDTIDGLVAQDKAAEKNGSDRVDPQTFIDVKAAFEAAINGLVDVTELKEVLAKADTVDGTLYTEDSYQAYAAAVESGKALLENGTEDTIADAIALITERYEALELKGDTALDDVIAEAEKVLEGAEGHYTTDSYNALKDIVAEAKEEGDDSYIDKIKDAMDALVSVDALRAKVNEANAVEKDTYTTSSYKVLSDLIAKTDELFESGSKDEISAMITAISDAIKGLEVRATGVEDYLESINLKDEAGYTEESYNAYKEAYDALMKADPSDLTADEFAALKANFEKAELALQKVQDDNGNTGDDNNNGNNNNAGNTDKDKGDKNDGAVATGDNASVVPIVIVLVLCVAAVVAVIIIRKKKH